MKNIIEKIEEIFNYKIFTLNGTDITIISIILFLLIVVVFLFLSRILRNKILPKILTKFKIQEDIQFMLSKLVQYLIVFVGIIIAFQFIGIDLTGLTVVLGFLSVGIGFGLQNITSNFIAGIILLFERPISIGDRVTVGNTEGDVRNINIRSTTIRSLNNISYIVPNSEFISSTVINWSHGDKRIRIDLDVGVSYNSELDLVLKALREAANENSNVLPTPEPEVLFKEFGESSWNMQLRVWIENPQRFYYVKSELNCAIVQKFRDYKIEIPFPQRDLHLRSGVTFPIQQM